MNNLLATSRRRYVFLARMLILVLATGALSLYAISELSKPPIKGPTAAAKSIEIPDESGQLAGKTDTTGILTTDTFAISDDGVAVLRLPQGTQLLDAQGKPPESITVHTHELPLTFFIGNASLGYEFGPAGTKLNPPVPLTIDYNPDSWYPFAMEDMNCNDMHMGFLELGKPMEPGKNPSAPWLPVTINKETHSITAQIDHLGTLMIFCEVYELPISLDRSSAPIFAYLFPRR